MHSSRGMTLIELLIVVAVIMAISAIAVPGLIRARQSGNEASAKDALRTVNTGQRQFAEDCASGYGFASDLKDLAALGYVSPDLSANGVEKSGYKVTVLAIGEPLEKTSGCSISSPLVGQYAVTAVPVLVNASGAKFFASDTRGAIYSSPVPIPIPIPAGTPTEAP